MRRIIALAMVCAILLALTGCGKSAAVKETERLISEIGEVTADSAATVEAAEAAYKALTQEEKEQLENYDVLTAAREALDKAQLEVLRRNLIGSWKGKLDLKDTMAALIDAQFAGAEVSFGDYLESFDLGIRLTLNKDNTYQMRPELPGIEPSMKGLRDALTPFVREYLRSYIAAFLHESGIEGDFSTLEGLEEAIGTDLDSAIEQSLGMSLEDYVNDLMDEIKPEELFAGFERSGRYKVEKGKLYLSDAPEQEPDEAQFDSFTLSDDTLTLHVENMEELFGTDLVVLQREG